MADKELSFDDLREIELEYEEADLKAAEKDKEETKMEDAKKAVAERAAKGTVALTKEESFTNVIKGQLSQQFKSIQSVVPKHVTPERLSRVSLQALSRNPALFECTPETIVAAIVNCATLGLEPNLIGHAYIVPFYNNKTKKMEAQFQIGYKGLLDLARRSGEISSIYAHEIYSGDEFRYSYGLEKELVHVPAGFGEERGHVVGYYAVYKLKDGGFDFLVMGKQEIDKHRDKYSKAKSEYSPWSTAYDEMAKKTVLRKLIKYMPLSIEQQENRDFLGALETDEKIMRLKKDQMSGGDFIDADYVVNED